MRAQNCMMTRDLDASREQDLKSTCIHRSPVASAGCWLAACWPPQSTAACPAESVDESHDSSTSLEDLCERGGSCTRMAATPSATLAQQLVLVIGGRIERGLRDGGRRAGPSQGMSDMDGRALRASAITPDGRHPGRTARQPFWPFCGRPTHFYAWKVGT